MVGGSRLTDTQFQETSERIGTRLLAAGLSHRQAVVLMSTVYTFTVSFVIEEQAVFPRPGERSPAYDLAARSKKLEAAGFPFMRRAGDVLFDQFDKRFKESLKLIVGGAQASRGQLPQRAASPKV